MDFAPAFRPGEPPTPQAWCLGFVGGRLLLPGGDAQRLQPTDAEAMAALAHTRHYLGRLDGADCWALTLPAPPPGWLAVGLRDAMMQLPEALMALAGRAAQVVEWDRTHRFCGVCGRATEPLAHERARRCPGCGHTAYPRINPAMMALVWRRRGRSAELRVGRSCRPRSWPWPSRPRFRGSARAARTCPASRTSTACRRRFRSWCC